MQKASTNLAQIGKFGTGSKLWHINIYFSCQGTSLNVLVGIQNVYSVCPVLPCLFFATSS